MKKLVLVLPFLLSGCSVWNAYFMAKFDVNEYQYIARIRTHAEIGAAQCGTPAVKDEVKYIYVVAHEYKNYAQHIPRNEDSVKLSETLNQITDEFYKRYQSDKEPSAAYCRAKFTAISQSADNIQKVLGAKPR